MLSGKSTLLLRVLRRGITISQSPIVRGSAPSGHGASAQADSATAADSVTAAADSVTAARIEEPVVWTLLPLSLLLPLTAAMEVLNLPATVVSVRVPPSYPVHIRRGSLLSLYGHDDALAAVRSSVEALSPLRALLLGARVFQYQKLVATKPFLMLVLSVALSYWVRRDANRSFATLDLDGQTDWAVLPRDALQVYSGPSLSIKVHTLPRYILRRLAQRFQLPRTTPTGLFRWTLPGFTLLAGRGKAGLVARGSIYQMQLKDGEQVLLNRNHLVALTTNGSHDLHNAVLRYLLVSAPETAVAAAATSALPQWLPLLLATAWTYAKSGWAAATSLGRSLRQAAYSFLAGSRDYVKVIGPRTLLLQTSHSSRSRHDRTETLRLHLLEAVIATQAATNQRTSADYLNYVTVTPRGAVFESTPDFRESVDKIRK